MIFLTIIAAFFMVYLTMMIDRCHVKKKTGASAPTSTAGRPDEFTASVGAALGSIVPTEGDADVDIDAQGEMGAAAAAGGKVEAGVSGVFVPEGDVAVELGGGDVPSVSVSGLDVDAAVPAEEDMTPSKKSSIGDKFKKFKGMLKKKSVRPSVLLSMSDVVCVLCVR